MNHYPHFATMINEALSRLDRPPAWLAKRLALSESTVGRWLNQGTRPGDAETVVRIADILGMSSQLQEFLVAAGYGYQSGAVAENSSRPIPLPATEPIVEKPLQRIIGVPEVPSFFGREPEQTRLREWLTAGNQDARARLVSVIGQGGLGKTTLVAQTIRTYLVGEFDTVIWYSLLNAPLLSELVTEILNVFKGEWSGSATASTGQLLTTLMNMLRSQRCLLILDNFESVLASPSESERSGVFRKGYEPYQQLLTLVAQHEHNSCLLYTSREHPQGMARLVADYRWVLSLALGSLELPAGRALLQERGLKVAESAEAELIDRYSGNPLALNVVAEIVQAYFGGDVIAYLAEETPIFDDIRRLLDEQFARLTAAERDVMIWMAIARAPLQVPTLRAKWIPTSSLHFLLEAMRGLERRSLVEKNEGTFFLQNVLTDYVTEHIVETICAEVREGKMELLTSHALLDMEAAAYVRRSQRRMFHTPILTRLSAQLGEAPLRQALLRLVEKMRSKPLSAQGYAPGNLLNLLVELKGNLEGQDFSQLAIRHADLSDAVLPQVNFANAEFDHATFTHTFNNAISLAYSPDGTLLAGGSFSSNIYIWRTDSWQPVATLTDHTNWVVDLKFSPDGRILASGSYDGTIRLWDVAQMTVRLTITNPGGKVFGLSFHPEGELLASVGEVESVRIWRISDGALIETLPTCKGDTWSIDWHPDGRHLLFPTENGDVIAIWDYWERRQAGQLSPSNTGFIESLAISPDGTLVAAVGRGVVVHLWSMITRKMVLELVGHKAKNIRVAFGYDGQWLAASSLDRTVCIWELPTGVLRHTLVAHEQLILGMAVHPQKGEIASAANDHTLAIWDTTSGQLLNFLRGYTGLISTVCFSKDGKHVASGSYSGQLNIWDVETGKNQLMLPRAHERGIHGMAYSPNNTVLASGDAAGMGTIQLRHSWTGNLIRTIEISPAAVTCIVFSPDGSLIAGAIGDDTIRIWQNATGKPQHIMTGHKNTIYGLAFSPDGRWLASASADTTVHLWNVESGEVVSIFTGHESWCRDVSFHPSGSTLASAGDDHTVRLWSIPAGKEIAVFRGHDAQVRSLTYLPDGNHLLSGSYDGTLRLWDTASGKTVKVFRGHRDFVMSVDISPDGRLAVSGGFDETVRVWEIETGECLWTLRGKRPYEGVNIAGAKGLSTAQVASLKELGAVEYF